jgi:hypothetical protein
VARGCTFTVAGELDSWEWLCEAAELGAAHQLSTETVRVAGVTVKALAGNTGIIYVGGPDNQYFELSARESVNIGTDDLAKVYVRAMSVGDGVCWLTIGA